MKGWVNTRRFRSRERREGGSNQSTEKMRGMLTGVCVCECAIVLREITQRQAARPSNVHRRTPTDNRTIYCSSAPRRHVCSHAAPCKGRGGGMLERDERNVTRNGGVSVRWDGQHLKEPVVFVG